MSIFTRFFEAIRKWFRPSRALPAPTSFVEESIMNEIDVNSIANEEKETLNVAETAANTSSVERIEFTKELKIQKQIESKELLDLQARFESNQIQLAELTDEELDNLNNLYQRQIDELKEKINKTKSEININMNKLDNTVLSA